MLWLDIIISAAVAMLAGVGVGGGGLLVIYLTLAVTMPQLEAQGINLLFFIAASLGASILNLLQGRVKVKPLLPVIICGISGGIGGALLAKAVSADLLRLCFAVLMIAAGSIGIVKGLLKSKR